MIRKLAMFALLAAFGVALAGCNTFEGMGQDIESLGNSLSNLAS